MAIHPDRTSSLCMAPADICEPPLNRHQTSVVQEPPNNIVRLTNHSVDEIEREEEQLRDLRDDLLGARYNLKTHRDKIRQLRQRAGVEEGSIISQLRTVFQTMNVQFPVDIDNALARINELRDNLGLIEAKYENEEEKYDQLEWQCTQKEESLIAKLLSQQIVHTGEEKIVGMDQQAPVSSKHGITPTGFPELQPEMIALSGLGYEKPLPITEALLQNLEQDAASTPPHECRALPSFLEHDLTNPVDKPVPYIPNATNETAVSQAYLDWNKTRKRVDKWILDTVSCSHYQQLILKSLISQDDLDVTTWWRLLTQHWTEDDWSTPPLGMNAPDSLYVSREAVQTPVITVSVLASSKNGDPERPQTLLVSQQTDVPYLDNGLAVHICNRPVDSNNQTDPKLDHFQPRDLTTKISETVSNAVSPTLNGQERSDSHHQLVTTFGKDPADHKADSLTKSSDVQVIKRTEDVASKDNPKLMPKNSGNEEIINPRKRHNANPEVRHPMPSIFQSVHHEYSNTTISRLRSPGLESLENMIHQPSLLLPNMSPPTTRSPSLTRKNSSHPRSQSLRENPRWSNMMNFLSIEQASSSDLYACGHQPAITGVPNTPAPCTSCTPFR